MNFNKKKEVERVLGKKFCPVIIPTDLLVFILF